MYGAGFLDSLSSWFGTKLSADEARVVSIAPLSGGASSETHELTLEYRASGSPTSRHQFVLRWDPGEGLIAPYDMERQFQIFRALAETDVPVPQVYWLELDASVIGHQFYVMELIDGEAPGRLLAEPDASRRRRQFRSYVETLAAIHAVDWKSCGLGFMGVPPPGRAYALRQVEAKERFLRRVQQREEPEIEHAIAWLRDHAPPSAETCLVHGDCSLSNYLFRDDRVVAVVDWELATLGDPLEDLGFHCGLIATYARDLPSAAQEHQKSEFLDAYVSLTGRSMEHLFYWEVFHQLLGATLTVSAERLGRAGSLRTNVFKDALRRMIGEPPSVRR